MQNSSRRTLCSFSMIVFSPNVKTKRYRNLLTINRISMINEHSFQRYPALFPLHFRQNWLNTPLPPSVPVGCVEEDGSEQGDPLLERRCGLPLRQHWDREAQDWSRLLGASVHDQESGKT